MVAQSIQPVLQPVVLLTRAALQSGRFGESLNARVKGARVLFSPLMAPKFVWPAVPDRPWQALIFTSETGAGMAGAMKEAGVARFPNPAFCVGSRTAQVAKVAGFVPLSASADAEEILALILSQPRTPLLHLRGRETRGDLARRLSASGVETYDAIIYVQEAQPLTPAAVSLLQGLNPVVIPLFSPRSAEILKAECLRIGAKAPLSIIALSAAVGEAAAGLSPNILIAAAPNGESMLEAVVNLLDAGQSA